MADKTNISWTDRTHNAWIGCTKKSAGCAHCYAENDTPSRVLRAQGKEAWGPRGIRHLTAAANRRKPYKWNKEVWAECMSCHWRGNVAKLALVEHGIGSCCPQCGGPVRSTRQRVFCSSLSDVFEDNPQLVEWQADLFSMAEACTNLDLLFLTKRIENVLKMVPASWLTKWPEHVIPGTTAENQEMANERIPILLNIPAKVKFLSCEPLLGRIDLAEAHTKAAMSMWKQSGTVRLPLINWVIGGVESGADARRHLTYWERYLRDQCHAAGIPYFFKQHGDNSDGGDPAKHHGGDLLCGVQYHEFPTL